MAKINLILLFLIFYTSGHSQVIIDSEGALVRSDTLKKSIYLIFTGHDQVDGFNYVLDILEKHDVKASFFLTGDFVRNFEFLVKDIANKGHFVGAHSDKHLLYCDWDKRDSLLHSVDQIKEDLQANLNALEKLNISPNYFMPPYEWYNQKVVEIASELNQTTVNFSTGTRTNADYTTPDMSNYISSNDILQSVCFYESINNMNGFHLLIHPGTNPKRTDKFYFKLEELVTNLKKKGYQFSKF